MSTKKFFLWAVIGILLTACNTQNNQREEELQAVIDSLQTANESVQNDLNDMTEFVTILANGLDSIARQEDILISNNGREGVMLDRNQLRNNLELFEEMLNQQKTQISQLADSLRARGANMERLTALVDHLNRQLEEKDAVIKQLRNDIDNKNVSIAQLRNRVTSLSESNDNLTKKVEIQEEALTAQDEMINEGYVKIGTKDALVDAGILTGGFLKKKRLNVDAIKNGNFMRVDIRSFTEIPLNSGNPKIISQMPSSSYRIEKTSKNSATLYVLDPTSFWSVSNYLVIQLN